MKLSLGDKTNRVVRFLLGVRNPRIATALAGYGFKDEDMQEGWSLLNALGKGKLAVLPPGPRDMETLLQLDAWENQWFPIAQAALDRRFPAVGARLFLNLVQTEGPEVAISVRTFVDRYDELVAGNEKFGAEAKQAHELLVTRGVTPAIVEDARLLLTKLTQVAAPAEPVSVEEQEAELEGAEAAMWAWYLEWSKDRSHRHQAALAAAPDGLPQHPPRRRGRQRRRRHHHHAASRRAGDGRNHGSGSCGTDQLTKAGFR